MADINVTPTELASARVRVYGKAQNRTALGIVNAYLIQYPHATMEDLEKAFPKSLNTDSGWPVNFKTLKEVQATENASNFFFAEADEVLKLQDGTKVVLCKMWTKTSFEKLLNHAKQYLIVVAEFEKSIKGEKGGFRLEYLNGWIPEAPSKKKMPAWIWVLILLAVLGIAALAFLLGGSNPKTEVVVVEVHDTLYVQQLAEIEKNFNAAEFVVGKADLSEEAKFVLHDLGKFMQKNPNLRLRIEGHTSAEGDANTNQALSEARAQAAVNFLIEHGGVDATRLEAQGFGSSKLKNAENPMAPENRRTEFEVIE